MHTAEAMLGIDNQLRLVLFGLECALNVEFSVSAIEQTFAGEGTMEYGVTRHEFYRASHLRVWGTVEEYEPGDLLLHVESQRAFAPSLPDIVERAQYQAFRMEQNAGL